MNNTWRKRFLDLAKHTASWSKDKSTKVSAAIVDEKKSIRSIGYNGFPQRIDDTIDERHERPIKYKWTEHAERNAIYHCARIGVPTENCTILVTHFPCCDCARAIIQSGIRTVIVDGTTMTDEFLSRWKEDFDIASGMLKEAGIEIILIKENGDENFL